MDFLVLRLITGGYLEHAWVPGSSWCMGDISLTSRSGFQNIFNDQLWITNPNAWVMINYPELAHMLSSESTHIQNQSSSSSIIGVNNGYQPISVPDDFW